jgi:hypothetical protein
MDCEHVDREGVRMWISGHVNRWSLVMMIDEMWNMDTGRLGPIEWENVAIWSCEQMDGGHVDRSIVLRWKE